MPPPRRSPARGRDSAPRYSPGVEAILAAIRAIPKGQIASYGEVAARAGRPRGARQVARVLHSLSEREGLPWHRVLGRNGCISLPMDGPGALQAALLRKEGLAVDAAGKVAAKSGARASRRGSAAGRAVREEGIGGRDRRTRD